MTTTDQFREDAEFLRDFAGQLARDIGSDDATRIEHIANSLDIAATVMFTPSQLLEKRAEEYISKQLDRHLPPHGCTSDPENQDVLLWLIYQALKSEM